MHDKGGGNQKGRLGTGSPKGAICSQHGGKIPPGTGVLAMHTQTGKKLKLCQGCWKDLAGRGLAIALVGNTGG